MDLREQVLKEHSRKNADLICGYMGTDPERFAELMHLFLTDKEDRVVQRTAHILGIHGAQLPELALPYLGQMLDYCSKKGVHVSVKRNVTRILQFVPVPEAQEETALSLCLDLLADPKEGIAVRCFAMGILADLGKRYPDICNELRHLIEDALEHQELSPAFRNKAGHVLKQIDRQQKSRPLQ